MAREYISQKEYDVAVAGGGIAAREGAKVVLLEKEYAWGGLATLGFIVIYLPLCDGAGVQMSGGICEELILESVKSSNAVLPKAWTDPDASIVERKKQRYQVIYNPATLMINAEQLSCKRRCHCSVRCADVGLMGLYIKDCKCLIELAEIAGAKQDIPELEYRLKRTEDALMTLWNEEDGIFENRDLTTNILSNRISLMNFYNLYSERVTEGQKKSMLERYFYDPKHFWGDYIMPSISRSDPAYPD